MDSGTLFELLKQSDDEPKPVPLSYVLEAINHREMLVESAYDAVYLLSCLNLLNRYVKGDRELRVLSKRDLYRFKDRASQVLEILVTRRFSQATCWIAGEVTYASLFGLQFSFHHLPKRKALDAFAASSINQIQEWSGFRLQPRAAMVLDWARRLRLEFKAGCRAGIRN